MKFAVEQTNGTNDFSTSLGRTDKCLDIGKQTLTAAEDQLGECGNRWPPPRGVPIVIIMKALISQINRFHEFPHDVTCLQFSIKRGLLAFTELLLDAGAEVNDFNPKLKVSSIHMAMRSNRPEALGILLRFGANVNQRDSGGRTPLHILVSQWNNKSAEMSWEYFDLLLSVPAIDINAQDNGEATPLELAVENNLHPVVKKLRQAGAIVNQHVHRAMEVH